MCPITKWKKSKKKNSTLCAPPFTVCFSLTDYLATQQPRSQLKSGQPMKMHDWGWLNPTVRALFPHFFSGVSHYRLSSSTVKCLSLEFSRPIFLNGFERTMELSEVGYLKNVKNLNKYANSFFFPFQLRIWKWPAICHLCEMSQV